MCLFLREVDNVSSRERVRLMSLASDLRSVAQATNPSDGVNGTASAVRFAFLCPRLEDDATRSRSNAWTVMRDVDRISRVIRAHGWGFMSHM